MDLVILIVAILVLLMILIINLQNKQSPEEKVSRSESQSQLEHKSLIEGRLKSSSTLIGAIATLQPYFTTIKNIL